VMRTQEVPMLDGQVACPHLTPGSTVDVEVCYRCPHLRAFHDEETGTTVECTYHPHLLGKRFASLAHMKEHLTEHLQG